MATLAIEGLTVYVAERRLVEGLSLTVPAGQRVALSGPSGAGKTMVLRAIAGLMDATQGRVTLDGRTGDELGWPEWRRRVLWVAQQPVMLEGTVRDNLERAFSYRSARGRFDEEAAERLLEGIGLPNSMDRRARMLSVGEKQRVALIRALLVKPDVLLLDEPTSALDADSLRAVEKLLTELSIGALIVTHDATQAKRLCDNCVSLGAPANV
jgi:putative ABC transport system ATP-binding protein